MGGKVLHHLWQITAECVLNDLFSNSRRGIRPETSVGDKGRDGTSRYQGMGDAI
jgi:hypothetical protein